MNEITVTGETDLSQYVGRKAPFTTYEGVTLIGTVERFEGLRPIIRFDDGKWAYGDAWPDEAGNTVLTFA